MHVYVHTKRRPACPFPCWLDVVREWCVNKNPIRKRKTIEEDVFSEIYRKMYKNRDLIQMWVPKEEWVDTKGESSARVLVESN
jgi:CCR4-NOT transcriptional regulation complex NOT5 subunit